MNSIIDHTKKSQLNLVRASIFTVVLAVLLSGAALAQKQTPPAGGTPKAFVLPPSTDFTLPNGAKVTLVPYGQVPKVAVTVVIDAGNGNEGADQVWLADFMGNLMKEGTQSRSGAQVAEAAAKMGGSVNINIGPDQTVVNGDVLSDHGTAFVQLLAEVVQKPAFPAGDVERLRSDLLRRLTIAKTNPGQMALERFRKVIYGDHAYGRVFPTEAMLKSYTLEGIKKFYDDNYGAARTHVYVAGRFDGAAMKAAISSSFSGWRRGSDIKHNIPKTAGKRSLEMIDKPGATQTTLNIGLPVIDPSNPDAMALRVTNALLGGSFGSRITSNIREKKGYTYSPSSQVSSRYRDAYWVEVADVTTAVTGPSIKEIFYEIDHLQKEAPSDAELDGIKTYLGGLFVLNNSSRQGVIGQLIYRDLHGLGDQYLATYVQQVYAVTPKQVQEIAQKYIKPEQMTIVVVGDKAKIADQVAPYEKASTPGGQ